jgi:hypothetical protein
MKTGVLFLLSGFFLLTYHVRAQRLPTIAERTSGFQKKAGFVPFYLDESSGKLYLELGTFDTDLLYVTSLPAGLGSNDIGLDRGLLGEERVVRFNRVGKKVLLVQPNLKYRAVTQDAAERRAVETSFAQSVLCGFTVEAEEGGRVLVDATDFLLRDAMNVAARLRAQKQGTYRADASRSALYAPRTKNFPQNTELEATVTFVGGEDAGNFVQSVAPSAEALSLRLHHSFVQLPDADYQPRVFDPRSSFIATSHYDYSTPVDQPIEKFFIIRHRLKKKNPAAKVSEAVEPIVYYLDNGTPEPIRSALLEGARWWNQAFEAAGYRDAFQVRMLPDSADPMDVRYNVVNWVHRSTRGWSYGASVVDPRTGEIIKGHVTLGSLRVRQDYLIAQGLLSPFETGKPADPRLMQLALNRLKQLAAHEIGHTLGLLHNYAASVNDRASVMDYPHPTVKLDAKNNVDVSDAYAAGIGAWDEVSINFGYREFPKGTDERKALNEILETAQKAGLLYLSDQDARPASSFSPIAHLWDNGRDPVAELRNTLAVRKKALTDFSEKTVPVGTPLALLEDALVPIYNYHRYQVEAAAKLVGAMDYRYALRGDEQVPTAFVPAERQLAALDAVLETLQPAVLTVPEPIVKLIPPRPAGYPFSRELFKKRTGLAFDPLAAAEAAADFPLGLLLNAERANRLVEHDARGNGPGLSAVLTRLVDGLWKAPTASGLERAVQQQTQQIFLTHLMALSQNETAHYATKAAATEALKKLKTYLDGQKAASSVDVAHVEYALERMKNPAAAKTVQHRELPPGAPIGCENEW